MLTPLRTQGEDHVEEIVIETDRSRVCLRGEVVKNFDNPKRFEPKVEIFASDIDGSAMSSLLLKPKQAAVIRDMGKMLIRLADNIDFANRKS